MLSQSATGKLFLGNFCCNGHIFMDRYCFSLLECQSATALQLMIKRCHGKRSCSIYASTYEFGDPCYPGIQKHLNVIYTCGKLQISLTLTLTEVYVCWTVVCGEQQELKSCSMRWQVVILIWSTCRSFGSPEWFNFVTFCTHWLDRKKQNMWKWYFINPFSCFFKAGKAGGEVNLLSGCLHTECWHPAAKLWLSVGCLLLCSVFISFCTREPGDFQSVLIHCVSRKSLPKSSAKYCNNFSNKILLFTKK